jgi:MerR family transcriptional regulator, thiopeptide resistance regulator
MADRFSIGAVARQTGIPVTTLRFYERELPGLFPIEKTRGGHRRYDLRDVSRFATVRSLTATGLPLSEVKRALSGRGENENLTRALERLAERLDGEALARGELEQRVEAIEGRLQKLEGRPPRPGWFGKR